LILQKKLAQIAQRRFWESHAGLYSGVVRSL